VVNVPGFPIPRPELAASAANPDVVYSLVAAAIVETDPNAMQAELIAVAVVDEVERRAQDAARRERASALVSSMRAERARKLMRQVPEKVDA
jgi:hypothetical protein